MQPDIPTGPYSDAINACVVATYAAAQHYAYGLVLGIVPEAKHKKLLGPIEETTSTGIQLRGVNQADLMKSDATGYDSGLYLPALARWHYQEMTAAVQAVLDELDGTIPILDDDELQLGEKIRRLFGNDEHPYAPHVYVTAARAVLPAMSVEQLAKDDSAHLASALMETLQPIAVRLIGDAHSHAIRHFYWDTGKNQDTANLAMYGQGVALT